MKKNQNLILVLFLVAFSKPCLSQSVIFSENFQSLSMPNFLFNATGTSVYGGSFPSSWTEHDVDGHINNSGNDYSEFMNGYGARTLEYVDFGTKAGMFFSYHNSSLMTEDWLITPQIAIPNSGSTSLRYGLLKNTWWITNFDTLSVVVSTNSNSMSLGNWQRVGYASSGISSSSFTNFDIDLSAFAGQSIFIGFIVKTESFNQPIVLLIDNIKVTNDSAAGILQLDERNMNLFPNPVTDVLNVNFDINKNREMYIYSADGKIVMRETLNGISNSVDVSFLNTGIYYVNFIDESNIATNRTKLFKK